MQLTQSQSVEAFIIELKAKLIIAEINKDVGLAKEILKELEILKI